MIRAYWLRLVLFAIVFGVGGLIVSLTSPKRYEGTIQIMIDQQPMNSSVPLSAVEKTISDLLSFSRPRSIQTQVEQLTSFGVLGNAGEAAANELGEPYNENSDFFTSNLASKIFVDAEPSSDVITLRVYMPSVEKARVSAQKIYDEFSKQNQKNAQDLALRARALLQQQMDPIKSESNLRSKEIQDLKIKMGTPDLASQMQADVGSIAQLKNTRDQAQLEYDSFSFRAKAFRTVVQQTPEFVENLNVTGPNPLLQAAQQSILQAKSDRSLQLEQYEKDAPQIKELDRRIANLEANAKALAKTIVASSQKQLNPLRQSALGQLSEAEANAAASKAKVDSATSVLAVRLKAMEGLPAAANKMDDLMRRKNQLDRQLATLAEQLDTVKFSDIGRSQITRLITPPFVKPDAVSPRPIGNTATAIAAGLLLGIISMFLSESKRQPIRTIAQMNSLAFEPVFRLIPELDAVRRGFTKRVHESFETLLLNFLHSPTRPYTVGVFGITRGAGASFTCASLATAAIRKGYTVTLVEHDDKEPLKKLAERGQKIVAEAGDQLRIEKGSAKPVAESSTELVSSPALIIHDFLPATESADYALEAAKLDEVIVLVRAGSTKSVDFMQVQQALKDSGCKHITLVFTRSRDFTVVSDTMERMPVTADFA